MPNANREQHGGFPPRPALLVCAAFLCAVIIVAAPAAAQSCSPSTVVYHDSAGINGETVSILDSGSGTTALPTSDFPMPTITIEAFTNCTKMCLNAADVRYTVKVSYVDQDTSGTDFVSLSAAPSITNTVPYSHSDDTAFTLDGGVGGATDPQGILSGWQDTQGNIIDLGGQVTVSVQFLDSNKNPIPNQAGVFQQPADVTFTINGANPSQAQVYNFYQTLGVPWFFSQILSQETTTPWQQFDSSGQPWYHVNSQDCAPKDSVDLGIAQIDDVSHNSDGSCKEATYYDNEGTTSDPIWNYKVNLQDAENFLQSIAGEPDPPYLFWDNQVSQMCTVQGGAFVGPMGTGNSVCSNVLPINYNSEATNPPNLPAGTIYLAQTLTNCPTFHQLADNAPSDWKDAELINAYNGAPHYYIQFGSYVNSTNQKTVGYWYCDTRPNNYVYNVCSKTAYAP